MFSISGREVGDDRPNRHHLDVYGHPVLQPRTESSFAQITIEAMQAFEVHLNGARVCVAGLDGDCVLSVMVDEISQQGQP
jgi:hypothetical protein